MSDEWKQLKFPKWKENLTSSEKIFSIAISLFQKYQSEILNLNIQKMQKVFLLQLNSFIRLIFVFAIFIWLFHRLRVSFYDLFMV